MNELFHYVKNYLLCMRGLLKKSKIDEKNYPELFKNLNIEAEKLLENLNNLKR